MRSNGFITLMKFSKCQCLFLQSVPESEEYSTRNIHLNAKTAQIRDFYPNHFDPILSEFWPSDPTAILNFYPEFRKDQ